MTLLLKTVKSDLKVLTYIYTRIASRPIRLAAILSDNVYLDLQDGCYSIHFVFMSTSWTCNLRVCISVYLHI